MNDQLRRIEQSHRLDQGRPALLVIDMQHGFLDRGASLEVPAGREIVPQIAGLIDACRRRGAPVIFTEFVYAESIPCLRGEPFGVEHLPAADGAAGAFGRPSSNCLIGPRAGCGAESAATIPQLAPLPGELVITAHTYDKFYGTHLDLALRTHGVDRLIATGVTTDVCVNATLMSAATRNYRVTAAIDGTATIHDHIQQACLEIWQNKFARLKQAEAITEELERK